MLFLSFCNDTETGILLKCQNPEVPKLWNFEVRLFWIFEILKFDISKSSIFGQQRILLCACFFVLCV